MIWNEEHATALCTLISGFDNRFDNDRAAWAAWRLTANAEGWDFETACKAVQQFYSRPLEADEMLPRIAPGHIAAMMRRMRPGGRGPAPASQVLALQGRGSGSSPEHRARLREQLAAELEARNVQATVKARVPWHDGPVREDVDDDVVVISSSPEERRALMHAIKGKPSRGLAEAFTGRPR